MGYFNVCIKDINNASYTDRNFRTIEEVYYFCENEKHGFSRNEIEDAAEVHFFGDKLGSFKVELVGDDGSDWIIEYFHEDYPGEGEGYIDMDKKLRALGFLGNR